MNGSQLDRSRRSVGRVSNHAIFHTSATPKNTWCYELRPWRVGHTGRDNITRRFSGSGIWDRPCSSWLRSAHNSIFSSQKPPFSAVSVRTRPLFAPTWPTLGHALSLPPLGPLWAMLAEVYPIMPRLTLSPPLVTRQGHVAP